jgi:hypothetical protein
MFPGAKISLKERLNGLLVVPGGAKCIHTIEAGSVLTIENTDVENGLVEVEYRFLHLLVSRESLEHCSRLSAVA